VNQVNIVQQGTRKIGMTAAEQFWYVLGCIACGGSYLAKVPVKKALSDYGLVEMTAAEQIWYTLGCIAFGAFYFQKVPVAKALSELEQFQAARGAQHGQLEARDQPTVIDEQQIRQALPRQPREAPPEHAGQAPPEQSSAAS
jgi:hypothetical protein